MDIRTKYVSLENSPGNNIPWDRPEDTPFTKVIRKVLERWEPRITNKFSSGSPLQTRLMVGDSNTKLGSLIALGMLEMAREAELMLHDPWPHHKAHYQHRLCSMVQGLQVNKDRQDIPRVQRLPPRSWGERANFSLDKVNPLLFILSPELFILMHLYPSVTPTSDQAGCLSVAEEKHLTLQVGGH